jgi:hypothetical protein
MDKDSRFLAVCLSGLTNQDWYKSMPLEYQILWLEVVALNVPNEGILNNVQARIMDYNLRSISTRDSLVTAEKALTFFNAGKNRVKVINQHTWLILNVSEYLPDYF